MILERMKVRQFRNYASLDLELFPGKNVLLGDNGQGKTNVLEAIYLCGTGRSYRTARDLELIRWGEPAFYAASRFRRNDGDLLVEVACSREKGKRIRLNGVQQEASIDYVGAANVVVFGPDDLRIVKGAPAERRRFLDAQISGVSERYRYDLASYRRVLMQRNAFLRDRRQTMKPSAAAALDVWDEQLVFAGTNVMLKRAEVIRKLSMLARVAHRSISPEGLLEIQYRPSCDVCEAHAGDGVSAAAKWAGAFHVELRRLRSEELARGVTLVGPHRDDVGFMLDGVDMRTYGSQGQQRSTMLAVRLGELEYVKQEVGENAILLLDDVSSELDPGKRARLWTYVNARVQTVITATDVKSLGEFGAPAKAFRVQGGCLEEVH